MNTKSIVKLLAVLLCIASLLTIVAVPVFADKMTKEERDARYAQREDSTLVGLKALFCGDSICAASTYDYSGMSRWGWAKRIGKVYGLAKSTNAGADGASVSNVRGDNLVVNQVKSNKFDKYDIVVLHGGTNDGWDKAPVGEMTAADCFEQKEFDVTTYAGGLEDLFATAKKLFPDAVICYIINFKTPSSIGTLRNMTDYYTVGKAICEKWEIPYLDLYFDDNFNNNTWKIKRQKYTVDQIHPNGDGYDVLYPLIGEFMEECIANAKAAADPTSGETSEATSGGVTSEVTSGETSGATSGATSEVTSAATSDTKKTPDDGNHTFLLVIALVIAALFIATGVIVIVRKKEKK